MSLLAEGKKKVKVNAGTLKVPYVHIYDGIEIRGQFEFENGWAKRDYPTDYKSGITIKLTVKDRELADGLLIGKTDSIADWKIVIDAGAAATLSGSELNLLKQKQFVVKMYSNDGSVVLWDGRK